MMLRVLVAALACTVVVHASVPPTPSSLWPLPQSVSYGGETLPLPASAAAFTFTCTADPEGILAAACARTKELLYPSGVVRSSEGSNSDFAVSNLSVTVTDPNTPLNMGVVESYSLVASTNGIVIEAETVWGALHGLQTLEQLVQLVDGALMILDAPVHIQDEPRFQHRGLLVDTSRHYLPVDFILHIVDGLAMNKMNVMHMHLVDAQSFPVESAAFPKLTDGAYAPYLTYSTTDLKNIVNYARARGVRVVAEIDVPGHAYSWGKGYTNLTATCPEYAANINNIPLNPCNDFTYEVLHAFLGEMLEIFPDQLFHLGGDEVVEGCWGEDKSILQCMAQKGYRYYNQLMQYFVTKNDANILNAGRTPVHWEDVFDSDITVDKKTIYQVWKTPNVLQSIVEQGFRALFSDSDPWYLNCGMNPGCPYRSWETIYSYEPFANLTLTAAQKELVLGGEAAMWAMYTDETNWDPQVWPRNSAVAERLWSAETANDVVSATPRLAYHRCRMVHRGFDAAPLNYGFCPDGIFP